METIVSKVKQEVFLPLDLEEENKRLTEELAQCNADKDFVWSLWKQLQKDAPDMAATVDMVVMREKLKHKQKNENASVLLQAKDTEIATLKSMLEAGKLELSDLRTRLCSSEAASSQLESKMEAKCNEIEKQTHNAVKAMAERDSLQNECVELAKALNDIEQNKEQLHADNSLKQQEIETLRKEASELKSRAATLLSQHSRKVEQCSSFENQLIEKDQLLYELNERNETQTAELNQLRTDLKESNKSCDQLAHQNTLQITIIHRLQSENSTLKTEVTGKEERLMALSESCKLLSSELENMKLKKSQTARSHQFAMKDSSQVSTLMSIPNALKKATIDATCEEVKKLSKLLEKTERDLFETKAVLKAKSNELLSVRGAHDRRSKRMQGLQTSYKLVLEQLKTYETKEYSYGPSSTTHKPTSTKELQQEDSKAVWNELSHYKAACEELVKQKLLLEEERDTYYTKCLRKQTTITELQAALGDKDDLEKKISAIVAVEPLMPTFTPDQYENELKVLRTLVEDLQQKNKQLVALKSDYDRELHQLHEEVTHMQSVMECEPKPQYLTKSTMTDIPQYLSKSTMTDIPQYLSKYTMTDTLEPQSTEDSTEVECATPNQLLEQKPKLKNAQTSPWKTVSQMKSVSTMTDKPGKSTSCIKTNFSSCQHVRRFSESDIFQRKKFANYVKGTVSEGETEFQNPRKLQAMCSPIKSRTTKGNSHQSATPGVKSVTHNCKWRKEVKTLSHRLLLMTKKVNGLTHAKQSLTKSLEEQTSTAERLEGKSAELSIKLHKCKVTVRCLQSEKAQLLSCSKELQMRVQHVEAQFSKQSYKETESKLKDLMKECSSLKFKLKTVEDRFHDKVAELHSAKETSSKLERDVKQKRQLIESLRTKLKQAEVSSSELKKINERLAIEITGHLESSQQSKHKIELLRLQLSKQTRDNDKLMELLTSCQDELAHTIEQLNTCQENSDRRDQLDSQAKKSMQQRIKQLELDCKQKLSIVEHQLQEREEILKDFQEFIEAFATELEKSTRKKTSKSDATVNYQTISESVRNIARASLNLTEFELDEFFQDTEFALTADAQPVKKSFVALVVKTAKLKPPFASQLVKAFMDFLH